MQPESTIANKDTLEKSLSERKSWFLSRLTHQVTTIVKALRKLADDPDDQVALKSAITEAHRLRGTGGTFGLMAMSIAAGRLEDQLRRAKDSGWHTSANDLLSEFESEILPREKIGDLSIERLIDVDYSSKHPARGHIALLDDDEVFIFAIDAMLRANGYRTTLLTEASRIDHLIRNDKPDLLLVDIEMPDTNGIEVCAKLKADPDFKEVSIVFLTAYDDVENRIMAFESKADDFIAKPVIEKELMARIDVRIDQIRLKREREDFITRIEKNFENTLMILDRLDIGVVVTDESGVISFTNKFFRSVIHMKSNHLLGKKLNSIDYMKGITRNAKEKNHGKLNFNVAGKSVWFHYDRIRYSEKKCFIYYFYDKTELYELTEILNESNSYKIIGRSCAVKDLKEKISRLAQGSWTVLIEGETGSGKELVAQNLHQLSERRDEPFIAVNCATFTPELISSQLFGHRRGAFTGAYEDQQGVFEAAEGGTLFLDEIGDIPASVQSSLLRVLEERVVIRMGETKPRRVNVRIIVATHKDLSEEIKAGKFRQDLFYRINVARIRVPSLRERRSDIGFLANWFLKLICLESGRQVRGFDQAAMELLMSYDWPGNVRELRNCVEYAVINTYDDRVSRDSLPPEVASRDGLRTVPVDETDSDEKSTIVNALRKTGGNRSKAARLLGISRATLYRRISELDIMDRSSPAGPSS